MPTVNIIPGSVLITTSRHDTGILGFASKLIRLGERLINKKAKFTHTTIVEDNDTIIEATVGGVQVSDIDKYIGKNHITRILTPPWMDKQYATGIINEAQKYLGRPYGYIDLPIYLLDLAAWKLKIIEHRGTITKALNRKFVIVCSELVARAYWGGTGYRFKNKKGEELDPADVTPTDIWVTAQEEGWQVEEV